MNPRSRTGIFLLLFFSVFLSLRSIRMSFKSLQKHNTLDRVSANENRLDALPRHLPKRGIIGFLEAPSDHKRDPGKQLFLARYTLAPLVVIPFSNQDTVIVNSRDRYWRPALPNYRLQHDFGNGVLVFVKEQARQ